jgi:PDZ domain-containing protein
VDRPGQYLLMSARVRHVFFGEFLLGTTSDNAADPDPLESMGEAKVHGWRTALDAVGPTYLVDDTLPGSPAQRAGLRHGDVLSAVDQAPVSLEQVNADLDRGRTSHLRILRSGRPLDIDLVGPPGLTGGMVLSGTATSQSPPPLSTGDVQGPSGGLVLALADVEMLTPGSLNGGRRIAATGEVDLLGDVVPVAGYRQKAEAAAKAGAEVFLVPMLDAAEVRRNAPPGLEIVGVATVSDAVRELCRRGGTSSACGR